MFDVAAIEPVAQVVGCQQRGGGNQHGAELDGREHDLPQRHLVAEHHQDAVATPDADVAQEVGNAVGACRHFGER